MNEYARQYQDAYQLHAAGIREAFELAEADVVTAWLERFELPDVDRAIALVGCTDVEIEAMRIASGGWLPESYVGFLQAMGHSAGMANPDHFGYDYRWAIGIKSEFDDWLRELGGSGADWFDEAEFRLPEDSVVIATAGSDDFLYLRGRVPDPEWWVVAAQSGHIETDGPRETFSERVLKRIGDATWHARHRLGVVAWGEEPQPSRYSGTV